MLYGIIVSYYAKYSSDLISEFELVLSSISSDYKVLVVCNGDILNPDDTSFIEGDNSLWEFSGWRKGFDTLKSRYGLTYEDTFVFCNDTFKSHRKFNVIDRLFFSHSVKKQMKTSHPFLVGDFQKSKKCFSLFGHEFDTWFSSYLFATDYYVASLLHPFHYSEESLDELIISVDNSRIIFNKQVSAQLSEHLNSWLYPKFNAHGWYNRAASLDLKAMKTKAILNEKRLITLVSSLRDAKVVNFYSGFGALYKRLKIKFGF